jgi:hypothetical protein
MDDFLKSHTAWYKAASAVFASAFLIALVAHRDMLTIIFGGAFLIGIGEWTNHSKMAELRLMPNGGFAKIISVPRMPNMAGRLLQLAGAVLIGYGIYRYRRSF